MRRTSTTGDAGQHLAERFDDWRKSRRSRAPIPEVLWCEAAELARRDGIYKTSRLLRLDYGDLKKRVAALTRAQAGDRPASHRSGVAATVHDESPTAAAFVELLTPALPAAIGRCSLEVQSARGARMRIEMAHVPPSVLSTLIREFAE